MDKHYIIFVKDKGIDLVEIQKGYDNIITEYPEWYLLGIQGGDVRFMKDEYATNPSIKLPLAQCIIAYR